VGEAARLTEVAVDREGIEKAHAVIRPHVRVTPVLELSGADVGLAPFPLTLKLELLQHSGSFRARGAFANLLLRSIPPAGVVAASGGNHGAAVAYAAMRGQGTLGLELSGHAPALDTLLIAVGGGGLIGGVAAWYAGRVRVIGVEPEAAPTLTEALKAGAPVDAPAGGVAADSLAPRRVGALMFPIARAHVTRVALVSDDAIRVAQQRLWESVRIVAEPGGAAALAALLSGVYVPAAGERVGVVLSGGNTTAVDFAR
jgi:threonine dehydratase